MARLFISLYVFITLALIGLSAGLDRIFSVKEEQSITDTYVSILQAANQQNLHLTVFSNQPDDISLESMVAELEKACDVVNLKRFDESADFVEASFLIEFASFNELNNVKQALKQMDNNVKISFLDNKGIVG